MIIRPNLVANNTFFSILLGTAQDTFGWTRNCIAGTFLACAKSPICKHDTAVGRSDGWAIGYQIAASEVTTETKTKERRNCCVCADAEGERGGSENGPKTNFGSVSGILQIVGELCVLAIPTVTL